MNPTSRISDSHQGKPVLTNSMEEAFLYKDSTDSLTMTMFLHRICSLTQEPFEQCFITAQQLPRGPGSKWKHMVPIYADCS